MRVFVVEVVLADVDHGKRPELGKVHLFVQHALAQRSLPEEAGRHLPCAEVLRRKRGASGNPRSSADNRVRPEIPGGRIGDVHRSALSLAVAGFLAQQLGEHPGRVRALRKAVSVTTMRARDVVVPIECLAHADSHGLFPYIQVREPRHQGAGVQIVDPFLEQADRHHLPVHAQKLARIDAGGGL